MNWQPNLVPIMSCDWKIYRRTILLQYFCKNAIGALTRALVAHTDEEFTVYFTCPVRNLFSIENVTGFAITATTRAPDGGSTSDIPEGAEHESSYTSDMEDANQTKQMLGGQHRSRSTNYAINAKQNRSDAAGVSSVYVGQLHSRSDVRLVEQVLKSQQTFIIETMIGKLNEILKSYRNKERRDDKIEEKITNLIVQANYHANELKVH